MSYTIKLRRDTAVNWTYGNHILAQGEIGFETDTKKFKIGDGTTAWASLPYVFINAIPGSGMRLDATTISGHAISKGDHILSFVVNGTTYYVPTYASNTCGCTCPTQCSCPCVCPCECPAACSSGTSGGS
jgi:Major tropism determinant N-terminal domain